MNKILNFEHHTASVCINFEEGQPLHVIALETGLVRFTRTLTPSHVVIHKNRYPLSCTMISDKLILDTETLSIHIDNNGYIDIYDSQGRLLCSDYRGTRNPFERKDANDIVLTEGHKALNLHRPYAIEIKKAIHKGEVFYGLGETSGHLDKKGYEYVLWNTDDPTTHNETYKSMYKSVPFYISLLQGSSYGIFHDNPHRTFFDFGKENDSYLLFGADEGIMDYYFIQGPKISDVLSAYGRLTGYMPLPPIWSLGYHQSRWGYPTQEEVLEISSKLEENDIPCNAIHLDIDHMDGYRVFTWNQKSFPDPAALNKALAEKGRRLVTIVDPGVKKDKDYHVFDEGLAGNHFVKDRDGVVYINEVWPGEAAYPDFYKKETREWWGKQHDALLNIGVSGIWNDMNEPASFRGPLPEDLLFGTLDNQKTHSELHNLYGHYMSMATYEAMEKRNHERPFVITRTCYAGTQRYASVWTGDNQSVWEHLRMAVPMLLNLGLSGYTFCGTDVGGFGHDSNGELLARWYQLGCFSPLFRNHCCAGMRSQEPWAFGSETLSIARKYVKLRYRLLPYLYDCIYESTQTGLPVLRALAIHYPSDSKVLRMNDQFQFGESILIAPVLMQAQVYRQVYLPEGGWYDFWTGEHFKGSTAIVIETPLDHCPIFAAEGTIIPINSAESSSLSCCDTLTLTLYPGNGEYLHYEDDGLSFDYKKGIFNLYKITQNLVGSNLDISLEVVQGHFDSKYKYVTLDIKGNNSIKLRYFNNKTKMVLK